MPSLFGSGCIKMSHVKYLAAHVAVLFSGCWPVTGAAASSVSPISDESIYRAYVVIAHVQPSWVDDDSNIRFD